MDKEFFVSCECGCNVLKVEPFQSKPLDEDDDLIWLCIYKSWGDGLWSRIKNSFRYLRYGYYAFNDMTIKKKELKKLIEYLQEAQND